MKKQILITFMILLVSLGSSASDKFSALPYVDPMIGTGANESSLSGNNYPGATAPFGMIQLSPDTRNSPDWDCASGYNYRDEFIYGFSHTHLSGTGVAELFDVLLMPVTAAANVNKETIKEEEKVWKTEFSHDRESASAGYYQVQLDRYGINAELTASKRVGVHRYTYPANDKKQLVVDLDHSRGKSSWGTRIMNAQIKQIDEYTVVGYRMITGWAKLRKVYFYAKFSSPITSNLMLTNDRTYENVAVANGEKVRAIFDFDTMNGAQLEVKLGLSAVSVENAKLNLETETSNLSFDQVRAQTEQTWEKELGKIEIEGTEEQKKIFYTALYHASIQPNIISDVNGEYMSADYNIRKLKAGMEQYTTFSLWDTYRAAHPLYTIVQEKRTLDFVNSMMDQYNTYGYLPIWQLWGQDNYCMIGNHAIPVIVDAILKGVEAIDVPKAYEAIKQSSLTSHLNSPFEVWEKYGYMPENIQTQSVSISLEIAYNDWCVAALAKKLGKEEDYKHFSKRAQFYKNLYNEKSSFFQSKDDKGNWMEPFDPLKYGANGGYPFTEGNAWQYFWYVPHDVSELITMVGGNKAFTKKLDDFFTIADTSGDKNDNASGFIGQYAHGNEPSHHVVYLYNFAKQPWKTQKYANQVMTELYNTSSSGYAGNDDCGQMSAWYVFSAMGFYPVNPANGEYSIGSPLVKDAKIKLESGKEFHIEVDKKDENDIYIQSMKLNGKPYNSTSILHSDIMNGGNISFKMGSKPSTWGVNGAATRN